MSAARDPVPLTPLASVPTLDALAEHPQLADGLPLPALVVLARQAEHVAADLRLAVTLRAEERQGESSRGAPNDDEWLTVEEARKIIGVSRRWFSRRKGKLPFVKKLSGRITLVSKKGLLKWIAAQTA